ncbi:hypothetical protein BGZ50_000077 [Haplosporangium sp. Z 11]|nr:hypothetical protein BGZ50_000077 [Haplosporangium sp. Z 11]
MQHPEQQVDQHSHPNDSTSNTAIATTQSTPNVILLKTPVSNPYGSDYEAANTIAEGAPVPHQTDSSYDEKSSNNIGSNTIGHDKDHLDVVTPASTTHVRKQSLTDTVIIGAVTAASGAVTAATTVVEVARRLVTPDDNDDLVTPKDEIKGDSSKGIFPSLLKTPADHNGLEFSQRKLSKDRGKQLPHGHDGNGSTGVQTHAGGNNSATIGTVNDNRVSAGDKNSDTGVNTIASAAEVPAASTIVNNQTPVNPLTQSTNNITQLQADDIHTASGGESSASNSNGITGMQDKGSTTAAAALPLNTLYVAGHGPGSASHGAMSVDPPAVSLTATSKAKHTGMGVDIPKLVGQPRDPKVHRVESLHVDRKGPAAHPHNGHEIHAPHYDQALETSKEGDFSHSASIQTSKDNNQVIHGNYHHLDQKSSAKAASIVNMNPYEAHMSHHRGSVSSGLSVDHPVVPTATLAGSGSSDNTNRNRPPGIYNSAINVDKAGASDRKSSGMGVDNPATVTHHMAHTQDPLSRSGKSKTDIKEKRTGDADSSRASGSKHYPEDDNESLIDKVKGVFRRRSSGMKEPRDGQVIAPQSTSHRSSSSTSSSLPPVIPDGYNGPVPEVGPGQEVVWVKKTIQTDYYEVSGEDAVPPEHGPYQESNRNSSSSSFLHRLRGRNSTSVDKGKGRM